MPRILVLVSWHVYGRWRGKDCSRFNERVSAKRFPPELQLLLEPAIRDRTPGLDKDDAKLRETNGH